MCSNSMNDLILNNDNAQWECGFQAGRNGGPVALGKISKALMTRVYLSRAIEELEHRADWWGKHRSHISESGL